MNEGEEMKQQTLSVGGFDAYRKTTRKAEFLSCMDSLVQSTLLKAYLKAFLPRSVEAMDLVAYSNFLLHKHTGNNYSSGEFFLAVINV